MKSDQIAELKQLVKDGKIEYDSKDTIIDLEKKYKDFKIKEAITKFQDKGTR